MCYKNDLDEFHDEAPRPFLNRAFYINFDVIWFIK